MPTGLLATAFACYKTTTFSMHNTGDSLISSIKPALFAKLEEVLGVIAACMPCLKHPAEELLRKTGVLGEQHFPGMSRPSFVLSSREQRVVVEQQRQFPLQDAGGLVSDGSQRSRRGLVRTRSTEWTGGGGTMLRATVESGSMKAERTPSRRSEIEEV
jgi:hypothetical protein